MKLKRVVENGEVVFYNAATNKEVRRERMSGTPTTKSSGIATLMIVLGVINIVGGLISVAAFIDKDAAFAGGIFFASVIFSVILFVAAKILNTQNTILARLTKLENNN